MGTIQKTLFLTVLCFHCIISKSHGQGEEIVALLEKKNKVIQSSDVNAISSLFHTKGEIKHYPNEKLARGEDAIKDYYASLFTLSEIKKVTLLERMTFKSVVIDKELLETETTSKERVVFYRFKKNKIKMMMILEGKKEVNSPLQIVDRQLRAYNQGNIDAFVGTYSKDIKVHSFGGGIMISGERDLRENYSELFKNGGVNCSIEKRMTMGNAVIDYEIISGGVVTARALAVYEVEAGLISRVSLLQ